ncbi:hypothetical protein K0U27_00650 [archaeon]|nr:hypothetical protein [archaeon]
MSQMRQNSSKILPFWLIVCAGGISVVVIDHGLSDDEYPFDKNDEPIDLNPNDFNIQKYDVIIKFLEIVMGPFAGNAISSLTSDGTMVFDPKSDEVKLDNGINQIGIPGNVPISYGNSDRTDSSNYYYRTIQGEHKVIRYHSNGDLDTQWELDLSGFDFMYPSDIAVNKINDHLFVYARGNVLEMTLTGECVAGYDREGKKTCEETTNEKQTESWRYRGVAVAPNGDLYFVPHYAQIAKIPNGSDESILSGYDTKLLGNVYDLAVHPDGNLYSANFETNTITSFSDNLDEKTIVLKRDRGNPATIFFHNGDLYYSIYDETGIRKHDSSDNTGKSDESVYPGILYMNDFLISDKGDVFAFPNHDGGFQVSIIENSFEVFSIN